MQNKIENKKCRIQTCILNIILSRHFFTLLVILRMQIFCRLRNFLSQTFSQCHSDLAFCTSQEESQTHILFFLLNVTTYITITVPVTIAKMVGRTMSAITPVSPSGPPLTALFNSAKFK